MILAIRKKRVLKPWSVVICTSFLFQIIYPAAGYALTSGPTTPEVQSFEPIGTTQLVDPFTGDFNYNIPLLDVGGYPVNLHYHAGIGMDQEASWVGLGWNINPGVINRDVQGIPDDFMGDEIDYEFRRKKNTHTSLSIQYPLDNLEAFGFKMNQQLLNNLQLG